MSILLRSEAKIVTYKFGQREIMNMYVMTITNYYEYVYDYSKLSWNYLKTKFFVWKSLKMDRKQGIMDNFLLTDAVIQWLSS